MLKDAIEQFWPIYAKAVDIVAALFPIWDLEDVVDVKYMLEEDAETLGFKPLFSDKTNKVWYEKDTGALKARFSDIRVQRVSGDEEMLVRVKDFLADGLYLANDDDTAPIKLRATRILHRDAQDVELPIPIVPKKVVATAAAPNGPVLTAPATIKPLSYAAAAANGNTNGPTRTVKLNGVTSSSTNSQDAQLMRMVDDLVEDEDDSAPSTPPQPHSSDPAVVARGDGPFPIVESDGQVPNYSYQAKQKPIGSGRSMDRTPPILRTPKDDSRSKPVDRLQSVSSLWNDSPGLQSSQFPAGLPTGTLGSPAHFNSHGHSRVNSASSIRSRTSQTLNPGIADSWSSIDSAPRATLPNGLAAGFGMEQSNVASPLLFGAGDSVWSTSPNPAYRNVSPPNGQGG
jgi:hypothetical protein